MHFLLFLVTITGNIQRKHKPNILIALSCHNGMWPKCWSCAAVGLLRPYHLLQATVWKHLKNVKCFYYIFYPLKCVLRYNICVIIIVFIFGSISEHVVAAFIWLIVMPKKHRNITTKFTLFGYQSYFGCFKGCWFRVVLCATFSSSVMHSWI